MTTTKSKHGETARRIYAVLHRNPDLTCNEIAERLPDLTTAAVSCALHKMKKNGSIEVRGRKHNGNTGLGAKSARTYHVKYKTAKVKTAKVKTPKAAPRVTEPKPEIEVMMLRHLGNISSVLIELNDNNKALIDLLKDTVEDLANTKEQLETTEVRLQLALARRNWWDALKERFA